MPQKILFSWFISLINFLNWYLLFSTCWIRTFRCDSWQVAAGPLGAFAPGSVATLCPECRTESAASPWTVDAASESFHHRHPLKWNSFSYLKTPQSSHKNVSEIFYFIFLPQRSSNQIHTRTINELKKRLEIILFIFESFSSHIKLLQKLLSGLEKIHFVHFSCRYIDAVWIFSSIQNIFFYFISFALEQWLDFD